MRYLGHLMTSAQVLTASGLKCKALQASCETTEGPGESSPERSQVLKTSLASAKIGSLHNEESEALGSMFFLLPRIPDLLPLDREESLTHLNVSVSNFCLSSGPLLSLLEPTSQTTDRPSDQATER